MTTTLTVTTAGAVQIAEKTFEQMIDEWFASDAMFRVREQSRKSYRKSLKAFVTWTAAQGIDRADKQDVKNWCSSMDAAGYSVSTKNLRLTTLRNFYKWLSAEHGAANIVDGLKGWADTREHKRGFLSCGEMKKLLAVVDVADFCNKRHSSRDTKTQELRRLRDKAIIGVMLAAGLRTIEINRLQVADVIFRGGFCYLNVIGKGRDAAETVKISRRVEELIRRWLTAREAVNRVSDESPLFCSLGNNSFGEAISSNSVSTLVKFYLEAASLRPEQKTSTDTKRRQNQIVAHSLRHSMATNALRKGASLMEVQQQLRHVNLSTTQIYLHEAQKAANRCTDLISEAIF